MGVLIAEGRRKWIVCFLSEFLSAVMVKPYVGKLLSAVGTLAQYTCITHCVFEYIGDFIVVS